MHNIEPSSTREATERLVKILIGTYAKADLKQVAKNATQLNAEKITQLLRVLEDLEDFFYGNLGDWATELVDPELNPGLKQFTSK